jgi:hypothetical protein
VSPSGGTITLAFPDGVTALQPFAVAATLEAILADRLTVEFTMVDMEMGETRYPLRRVGELWQASAIIPLCITGRSDWMARLLIQQGEGVSVVEFPFILGD